MQNVNVWKPTRKTFQLLEYSILQFHGGAAAWLPRTHRAFPDKILQLGGCAQESLGVPMNVVG